MAKKILVICEGAKAEPELFDKAKACFSFLEDQLEIFSYKSNIYDLYRILEQDTNGDWEEADFLLTLYSHEKDPHQKAILNGRYTDILLIFDLDPQDPSYEESKLNKLLSYFHESSDMGKLYVSYPMIEAFWDVATEELTMPLSDAANPFWTRSFSLAELPKKGYKIRTASQKQNIRRYSEQMFKRLLWMHAVKANMMFVSGENPANLIAKSEFQKNLFLKQAYSLRERAKALTVSTALFYFLEAYAHMIAADWPYLEDATEKSN